MQKLYLSFMAIASIGFLTGCAAWSGKVNLPNQPFIVKHTGKKDVCILVSRFGGTTDPDKELVPQILRVLPEVLRQQEGFSEIRLESEGKGVSTLPCFLIKGVVQKSANAAVPTTMMTTINFRHSSEVQFSVFDVSNVTPTKRFDDTLQTSVFTYDVTSAKKLFSSYAKTNQKASYGAQADIPKFVSDILEIAARDLSNKIGQQVYDNIK